MQFLLLCCSDEKQWASLPESQRDAVMRDYGQVVQDLERRGQYLGGAKLQSASSAVTVREKNGRAVVTDGPFAETKEQLGGYHLIECRDREEALAIAKRIPTLRIGGTVEVRQLLSSTQV